MNNNKLMLMEIVVVPEKCGKGNDTELVRELINNGKTTFGYTVQHSETTICLSNKALRKVSVNVGFKYFRNHKDGDTQDYVFCRT